MERPVVNRLGRVVATAIVFALAAPGCFDVHLRDPGPFVIDDFDDGDLTTELPGFDPWACYSFNAQDPDMTYGLVPGTTPDSFALNLDFRIDDPPDGKQQHGGAALVSWGHATLDLTPYRTVVFTATLASGKDALPSDARLYLELGCSTAVAEDGSSPGDFYVSTSADYKNYPQTFSIDITSLGVPPWVVSKVQGGPAQCRALVDSIRFTVDAHLADGQSGGGVLTVDDIHLQ
jgi:hypothetical protein